MSRRSIEHDTNYTTRNGNPTYGDIGWEMFPEKTAITPMYEDSTEMLYLDRRQGLKDTTPVISSQFAYEEPQRNTASIDRLNLREGGARVTTDPWKTEDYDIQFHDKDPRGYTNEHNWKEVRRHSEMRGNQRDFRDDGGYQVTSGMEHPNTKYKRIRDTQKLAQIRMNIFDESFEGFSNANSAIFPNASMVYKSDAEPIDTLQNTWQPVKHINISNQIVNGGHFKDLNTTDHKVREGNYGKIYKNNGLVDTDTAIQLLDGEPQYFPNGEKQMNPRNLKGYMAAQIYQDSDHITPRTAAAISRILMSSVDISGKLRESMVNKQGSTPREIAGIIHQILPETEIKKLHMADQDMRTSGKTTGIMNVNPAVIRLIEKIAVMTPLEKLKLFSNPGPGSRGANELNREASIIDMKYAEFRNSFQHGRTPGLTESPPVPGSNVEINMRHIAMNDLQTKHIKQISLSGIEPNTGQNLIQSEQSMRDSRSSYDYSALIPGNQGGKMDIIHTHELKPELHENFYTTASPAEWNKFVTDLDNQFGDNQIRHSGVGIMGDKYGRRNQVTG